MIRGKTLAFFALSMLIFTILSSFLASAQTCNNNGVCEGDETCCSCPSDCGSNCPYGCSLVMGACECKQCVVGSDCPSYKVIGSTCYYGNALCLSQLHVGTYCSYPSSCTLTSGTICTASGCAYPCGKVCMKDVGLLDPSKCPSLEGTCNMYCKDSICTTGCICDPNSVSCCPAGQVCRNGACTAPSSTCTINADKSCTEQGCTGSGSSYTCYSINKPAGCVAPNVIET